MTARKRTFPLTKQISNIAYQEEEIGQGSSSFTVTFLEVVKLQGNLNASNMSLYYVSSLSNVPSLSTAVLNAVMCLSNFSGVAKI